MSFLSKLKGIFTRRDLHKQYRYPALAAANRVLIIVQAEITDFGAIGEIMEDYKKAQDVDESGRDQSYIPIYFELEEFVVGHRPPVVKQPQTVLQLRAKVRAGVDISALNEPFRLIFLPENQQADRLLKMGALEMLRYLLTSLGQAQLAALIRETAAMTPLAAIKITDDGISFEDVHPRMETVETHEVMAVYSRLYQALYTEIKNVFGEQAAKELTDKANNKIKSLYPTGLASIFLNALPVEARP